LSEILVNGRDDRRIFQNCFPKAGEISVSQRESFGKKAKLLGVWKDHRRGETGMLFNFLKLWIADQWSDFTTLAKKVDEADSGLPPHLRRSLEVESVILER
jgi:hypothetical protein